MFLNVLYNIKKFKGRLKICLTKEASILDVKEIIVNKLNFILNQKNDTDNINYFKIDQIAIIFCGQELNNLDIIANYDLGQNSLINVVNINAEKLNSLNEKKINIAESAILLSTNEENLNDNYSENLDEFVYIEDENEILRKKKLDNMPKKSYFFVYCGDKNCKKITLGKLRVKCIKCKLNTLIVNRGPQCWEDVLVENRIKGKCQNDNCSGEWAEFYFKCSSNEHFNNNLNEKVLPLEKIKHNTLKNKCLVCDDIKETIFVFQCFHVICIRCFTDYCKSKLNTREFSLINDIGYTLNCLFGCENSWIQDIHYFHVLSNKDYEKYHIFATEEFILQNGGTICPNPGCSDGILIDSDKKSNKIVCLSCNFVFCLKCKDAFHKGECIKNIYVKSSQDFYTKIEKKFKFQIKNLKYINKFKWEVDLDKNNKFVTKQCPNCNTNTEKDDGCMHIICSRSYCKFEWCWICEKKWDSDCMGKHWFE